MTIIQGKGCPKCRIKIRDRNWGILNNNNVEYQDGVRPPYLSKEKVI